MVHSSLWPWRPVLCSRKVLIRKQGLSLLPPVPPSPGWKAVLAMLTLPGRGRQNSAL